MRLGFSAVAAMEEEITKLSTGKLISLSEQELVDCDKNGNQGCKGGVMDYAFKFILQNNGLSEEEIYPYKGIDSKCNANKANHAAKI